MGAFFGSLCIAAAIVYVGEDIIKPGLAAIREAVRPTRDEE